MDIHSFAADHNLPIEVRIPKGQEEYRLEVVGAYLLGKDGIEEHFYVYGASFTAAVEQASIEAAGNYVVFYNDEGRQEVLAPLSLALERYAEELMKKEIEIARTGIVRILKRAEKDAGTHIRNEHLLHNALSEFDSWEEVIGSSTLKKGIRR